LWWPSKTSVTIVMTKKNVLTLEPWLTMDSMIVQIYQISYILWIAWQDPLPVETCSNVLTFYMNHIFFWVMQMSCFVQKKHDRACKNVSTYYSVPGIRSQNLCITTQALVPLLYQCSPLWFFLTIIANLCYLQWRLIIDRILRKRFFSIFFPIFRKYLSVSPWNLPGYFSVSFRFPQVTEFGKSTAIYLANFFCQLYAAVWSARHENPNDPQERCAMARTSWARL